MQIIKVLCQFASVVVLSRLLPPSDFGLIAMVTPIYGFVLLFQDMGLSQATIQKPDISHDEVNAFFWINVVVGFALTVAIMAISPLIGWYYHEPRVVMLSIAMASLVLLGSLGNQPCAILTRRMNFTALSVTGVIGAISGLLASVLFALWLKNYWALYVGMLVGTFFPVVGVWIAARWAPSAPRRVPGIRGMLSFGAGVTSANVLSFIARNADNVLIGHRWGDYVLGFYDRAYKLLLFPLQRLSGPVLYTMIPVLSRLVADPTHYRTIFLKTITQLMYAVWPGILWAVALSDTLVPVLLGKQWSDAAKIFNLLAFAGVLQVINSANGCLFVSQGRGGDLARYNLVSTIGYVAAFFIGLPDGATGVAAAYAICELILTPFLWWYMTRTGPIRLMDMAETLLPQLVSAAICVAALFLFQRNFELPSYLLLAAGLIISYGTYTLALLLTPKGRIVIRQALSILRHAITKSPAAT